MTPCPEPWPWVRTLLHSIYDQPDADSVIVQYDRVLNALAEKLPQVAAHLETNRPDVLAFTAFPKEIWRQIWSNNPQVIWSRAKGVLDVYDGPVRCRNLCAGRGYLSPSSTQILGRFDVRSKGGGRRLAA